MEAAGTLCMLTWLLRDPTGNDRDAVFVSTYEGNKCSGNGAFNMPFITLTLWHVWPPVISVALELLPQLEGRPGDPPDKTRTLVTTSASWYTLLATATSGLTDKGIPQEL